MKRPLCGKGARHCHVLKSRLVHKDWLDAASAALFLMVLLVGLIVLMIAVPGIVVELTEQIKHDRQQRWRSPDNLWRAAFEIIWGCLLC